MLKNQQRPVGRNHGSGQELLVHSIFDTIQGEGPYSGRRAIFIRLAGCNLQCPLCDTEYTKGAKLRPVGEIARMRELHNNLVVLTGGEPLRQNVVPLILELNANGCHVQIETNGTMPVSDEIDRCDYSIVVSPKHHHVHESVASRALAYKYVVRYGDLDVLDYLPCTALDLSLGAGKKLARPPGNFAGDVFIHPADEQDESANQRNMLAAVDAVVDSNLWTRRLGVQLHKYARLP